MKSVLISIQPKWCELIAIGKKTIEVRKTAPKGKEPFKVYIYQTKKKWIYRLLEKLGLYQGKVMGEFVCDEITTLIYDTEWGVEPPQEGYFFAETPSERVLADFNTCLTNQELINYGKGNPLYGWHISNLVIYDKPKGLREFKAYRWECETTEKQFKYCRFGYAHKSHCEFCKWIRRPPQSWCYVEV